MNNQKTFEWKSSIVFRSNNAHWLFFLNTIKMPKALVLHISIGTHIAVIKPIFDCEHNEKLFKIKLFFEKEAFEFSVFITQILDILY